MLKYLLLIPFLSFGQFYKYSTIYAGGSLNSTMTPIETYDYNNGQLINTTNDGGANYRLHIGLKKLSRYKFEKKPKFYYDGKEENATINRSSLSGFEYLLEYEKIKDRGIEFENHEIWFRYLGEHTSTKIQSSSNGYIDLQYKSIDFRYKHDFKHFRATLGTCLRYHPIYGLNPFKNDFPNYNDFDAVAQELGYIKDYWFIDENYNNNLDRFEQSFYRWILNGDTIAQNTAQFQDYYASIPSRYNREKLAQLGNQYTLSGVAGLSYYIYLDKFFVLAYANYFFINGKLSDYSSDTKDYDLGVIANWKLSRSFSLYSQLEYLNYFNRENYTINLGINLILI